MISLSIPHISGNEWQYIKECLDTGWVSSVGSYVTKFEEQIAQFVGTKYAVATSNGTAALHIALVALGIPKDAEVLVPTITFAATINAIHYCNAHPVFFDCDEHFNMDLDAVEEFLATQCTIKNGNLVNKSSGNNVWGIMPVHVFGNCLDMPRLSALAKKYNLHLIEDAAESLGSYFDGRHSGTFGAMGCISFNGNKIITTGGGGMVVTDSEELAKKVKYLTTQAKDDTIQFIHGDVGYNYRLTNIQAAMGVAQLECLPRYLDKKKQIYSQYAAAFSDLKDVTVCPSPRPSESNYWLTNIMLSPSLVAMDVIKKLQTDNIEARPIWYPNHLQKNNQHCQSYKIVKATDYVKRTISLPSSVGLTEEQQAKVIDSVKRALR